MPGMDVFGAEERHEVNEVLETGCLFRYNHEHLRQDRWKARELEAETRKYTSAAFAHAVSSGSTAVAAAMAASGLGFGDEIIVPPFTYIATIEGVLLGGGLPVFAEIDENLCLSAEGIEKVITPRTKGVMLVHMCGAAADMDSILAVCKKHNLKLLEDAGQALGAFYKGKSVGLFGEAGAFSLDFFKIITAGEGGLCITNDEKISNYIEQFSDHGHSHLGSNRGMEAHPILGTNFRLSELHAAVGLAQIRKLHDIRDRKRHNHSYLKSRLSEVAELRFRPVPDQDGDSGTFLNFFLPTQALAEQTAKNLAAAGIGVNYWFTNMYHFINQWDHLKKLESPFKMAIHHLGAPQDYSNLDIPISQDVVGRLLSVGTKVTWTKEDMDKLADQMIDVIRKTIG
jgi:8-amino-3,8-dideoxy-alpha-D-manno-octulosonate transaminase